MSNDYRARAQELDWSGLRALWRGIGAGSTPGWPAGRAFEHMILRAFEIEGAEVRYPFEVESEGEPLEQIDGAVHTRGLSCIVEAKDTWQRVDFAPIAKLRNQLARRPAAAVGVLFSRSGFTRPAVSLAQYLAPQTVLLWTGVEVAAILEAGGGFVSGLEAKYRYCVERASPEYDLRNVSR